MILNGTIERRILVNFIADPKFVQAQLPPPFRPVIYKGVSIIGVCLIRLRHIRPKGLPGFLGIRSENAAHRFAVEWTEAGTTKQGVYIPRRDSSSYVNHLVGGRIFPGLHYHTKFDVKESANDYHIAFRSSDGTTFCIEGSKTLIFNQSSVFVSLQNASDFFKAGAIGYSPKAGKFEGLQLRTSTWNLYPLEIQHLQSDFFDNRALFPRGAVQFDNALLMTDTKHEWRSIAGLG